MIEANRTKDQQLLPCPFCGYSAEDGGIWAEWDSESTGWMVVCSYCNAEGPFHSDDEKTEAGADAARDLWNKRATETRRSFRG